MEKAPIFNARHLMTFLAKGDLAIDENIALQYLMEYLSEVELAAMQTSEAGREMVLSNIKERKRQVEPLVLEYSGDQITTIKAQEEGDNVLSYDTLKGGSIAKLFVVGAMRLESGLSSSGMREFAQQVRDANANPSIEGILVKVNTGGGESMAGQEMYNAIKDSKKPVVVHGDTIASAGVMGVLGAQEIWLSGGFSRMGSVGVMLQINKELIEEVKQQIHSIYSEKSELKNDEFRRYLEGDASGYVKMLTDLDTDFMRSVRKHLPVSNDSLKGAMYGAREAVKRGFASGIATEAEALDRLRISISRAQRQNNKQLKSKTKMEVFKTVKSAWARLSGTNVDDLNSIEEVVEQMENATPFTEMREQIQKTIEENLSAKQAEEGQEAQEEMTQLTESVKGFESSLNEVTEKYSSLQTQFEKRGEALQEIAESVEGLVKLLSEDGEFMTRVDSIEKAVSERIANYGGDSRNRTRKVETPAETHFGKVIRPKNEKVSDK